MATIQFSSLQKQYSDPKGNITTILKGIDLDIAHGEFVVLVGPSGCGKSTLLKCLVGLTPVTAGQLQSVMWM